MGSSRPDKEMPSRVTKGKHQKIKKTSYPTSQSREPSYAEAKPETAQTEDEKAINTGKILRKIDELSKENEEGDEPER